VFFYNRLGLDFTYYMSKSTDMIYPVFVAPSSGYSNYYTNVGRMDNKGVEIAMDVKPVKTTSGFDWDIYGTFTLNRNEVKEINGVDSLSYVSQLFGDPASALIVGKPYGTFYGNVSLRDDEGNILIDPSDGFMIVDNEKKDYGSPYPDFIMGVTNTLRFKGLVFSFLVDYTHGGKLYSNAISTLLGRGVTKDTEDREKTMIIPGVYGNPNTQQPILDGSGNKIPNKTQISVNDLYFSSGNSTFAINSAGEWQVYDATCLRLRELTLGYDLPIHPSRVSISALLQGTCGIIAPIFRSIHTSILKPVPMVPRMFRELNTTGRPPQRGMALT